MNLSILPLDWLLEEENPSVRYRTLTELLDVRSDDTEALSARAQITTSKPVARIFSKMNSEGYWYFFDKRTQKGLGHGVEYFDYLTTHFNLAYLSELAIDRHDPRLSLAVTRYLSLQQPDGDFFRHLSCLYTYNLRNFIRMGYEEDQQVKRIKSLLLSTERHDGGYLCDLHEGKYKTRPVKSCIRGSMKALMAFAELPELWDTPRCKELVSYFLKRRVIYQTQYPNRLIHPEIVCTIFPFVWRASFLEALYALSVMGYGKAPELMDAWDMLETKKDDRGRYILDWAPSRSYFVPEKRGESSKWVTLYACLAIKHREETSY